MVVFGMVMIVKSSVLRDPIRNIGWRKFVAIKSGTVRSKDNWLIWVGIALLFGNAN